MLETTPPWNGHLHTVYFFIQHLGLGPSTLGPDPCQTLNYSLQMRSFKFSASEAMVQVCPILSFWHKAGVEIQLIQ